MNQRRHFFACIAAAISAAAGCAGDDKPKASSDPWGRSNQTSIFEAAAAQKRTPPAARADTNGGFDVLGGDAKGREPAAQAQGPDSAANILNPRAGKKQTWTIVLGAFPTDVDRQKPMDLLWRARGAGLGEAFLEQREKAIIVGFGAFESPNDQSRGELERIRAITLPDGTSFASAMLTPPEGQEPVSNFSEWDLSTLRQRYGKRAEYTLQVAVYRRLDGKDATPQELQQFRAAAEKACAELRAQGEEAFYFHGPRESSVTIGVFAEEDYTMKAVGRDGTVRTGALKESPAVLAAKARHPHLLLNGKGALVRVRGMAREQMQPTRIVSVPKS